jgi:hypothetical protein
MALISWWQRALLYSTAPRKPALIMHLYTMLHCMSSALANLCIMELLSCSAVMPCASALFTNALLYAKD